MPYLSASAVVIHHEEVLCYIKCMYLFMSPIFSAFCEHSYIRWRPSFWCRVAPLSAVVWRDSVSTNVDKTVCSIVGVDHGTI